MAKPRIKVPETAMAGDIIVIKTLVSHRMESGHRRDKEGKEIPREIINKFTCEFNGNSVFECELEPAIASNPYFEFRAKVMESGTFTFTWVDDDGSVIEAEREITVS